MKYCPKCKKNKREAEFYKNKAMKDGLYVYCKECAKEYDRQRYSRERERRTRYTRKWRSENRERANETSRKWRQRNPEKVRGYERKYNLSPKRIFGQLKYRGAKFSQGDFLEWYKVQEKKCYYCGIPKSKLNENKDFLLTASTGKLTIDKKDAKQGYTLDNIVLSCMRCNLIKSNFFSVSEMKQLAKKFITPRWQRK